MRGCLLAGTLSGTKPGIPIGNHLIPLNPDPWMTLSLGSANRAPYLNSAGRLDAFGRSVASLTLPPNLSSVLIGLTMHHAFVTWSDLAQQITFASNPVPLHFVQ